MKPSPTPRNRSPNRRSKRKRKPEKLSRIRKRLPRDTYSEQLRAYLQAELKGLLKTTVTAMWQRCLDNKLCFVDGQSVIKRSFVSTCEVLETIFLPMLIFGDDFLPKKKPERQLLNQQIVETMTYLMNEVRGALKRNEPLCPGDPYLNSSGHKQEEGSAGRPYIEANAFFVSTALHFLSNEKHFRGTTPQIDRAELVELARKAIQQILNEFDNGAWSRSKDESTRIYFTWSVSETLIDVLSAATSTEKLDLIGPERIDQLRGDLASVRQSMEKNLFGAQSIALTREQIMNKFSRPLYNALQAFITLGILATTAHAEMAQALVSLVSNSHLVPERAVVVTYYPLEHESGGAQLEDRSILPLILRAIATIFADYYSPPFREIIEKAWLRDPWSYLVIADRVGELKEKQLPSKLWGPDGKTYEIYYTERVIEALVSCYYYVADPDKEPFDPKLPKTDAQTFAATLSNTMQDDSNGRKSDAQAVI